MSAAIDRSIAMIDDWREREAEADENPLRFEAITEDELRAARLTPRVILPNLLYADVRTRIAAGGVGKTSLALFEAATLALGRELWGRQPPHQVRTVIVTREDSREILVARLREIISAMHLTSEELATALSNITVVDVSGVNFRVAAVVDDVVVPHTINLEHLIERLQAWGPDWLIFDPLISFGVGESRVNDSEQGIIEAFRILRNRLGCCVEGIHHSGKANARDKALDQYAGRGGSALSDGSRMVCVMQPLDPGEWFAATGNTLADGETGIVMALPKLSYAKKQESLFIIRNGFGFSEVAVAKRCPEQEAMAIEAQVCQFISHEYSQGRKYAMADLEASKDKLSLTRQQIRAAITALKVSGKIVYVEIKGKSGSHFEPLTVAETDGDTPVEMPQNEGAL